MGIFFCELGSGGGVIEEDFGFVVVVFGELQILSSGEVVVEGIGGGWERAGGE